MEKRFAFKEGQEEVLGKIVVMGQELISHYFLAYYLVCLLLVWEM